MVVEQGRPVDPLLNEQLRQGLGIIRGDGIPPPYLDELDEVFGVRDVELHIPHGAGHEDHGYISPESPAEKALFRRCGEQTARMLEHLGFIQIDGPFEPEKSHIAVYVQEGGTPGLAHKDMAGMSGMLYMTHVLFGCADFWSETTGDTILFPGDTLLQDLDQSQDHDLRRAYGPRAVGKWAFKGTIL